MKTILPKDFKVIQPINLKTISTVYNLEEDCDSIEKELRKVRRKLGKLQDTIYAHGKYAVLVCLQGMDTSGKDSLIREVFKDVNASGVEVYSFKVPTELELKHDFLWRHYIALPARGKMGIFNRTHYENVLVTRVHPEYILGENIPTINKIDQVNDAFFHQRMEAINAFESNLVANGTIILKFFLNLSKEEQKNRLLRRLELKQKNWKFSPADLKERKLWDKYQYCYQDLLNRTSTEKAPWFVIPADDKPTARLIVADTIYKTLKQYNFKEPELPKKYKLEIDNYKSQLENE
jgi:PPK2 family polyphosphate:nucleotide phosphotransferase